MDLCRFYSDLDDLDLDFYFLIPFLILIQTELVPNTIFLDSDSVPSFNQTSELNLVLWKGLNLFSRGKYGRCISFNF